jgi:hypothetical protein
MFDINCAVNQPVRVSKQEHKVSTLKSALETKRNLAEIYQFFSEKRAKLHLVGDYP